MAEQSGHGIFLWQMYRDLAAAYAGEGNTEEADRALLDARRLVRAIAGQINDADLRRTFLATKGVNALLSV